MQVFRTYYKLLKKQLVSMLIYGVLFMILTIIISSTIKVENKQFETEKVATMVINEDGRNEFIDGFINYLSEYVTFVEPENEETRKDALFYRKVVYILTIPQGFTDQFIADGTATLIKETVPDTQESFAVDNAVNNYMNKARVYLQHVPNIKLKDLNSFVSADLKEQAPVTMEVKKLDEVTYTNIFNLNYFNYLAYILMASFITGISVVMHSFHGLDIRRRHAASPLTNRNINFQLILGNFTYVIAYLIIFIAAGYVLNRDRMVNANTLMTWLNAFVFSLTVLALSYLVGISVTSKKAVQAIATAVSLSFAFISGVFVPQQFLSASVLKVASFTPAYWYVKANNAIEGISSLHWAENSDTFGYMTIQLGFALALFSISLVVSKRKRQQAM